jgi:hypothetical protein
MYGSYVDEPLRTKAVEDTYYYAVEHLTGISALTDSTGGVVESYKYDADLQPICQRAVGGGACGHAPGSGDVAGTAEDWQRQP